MPKTSRRMPPWSGVAQGNTATLQLPIGLTYHALYTTLSGITPSEITQVRLRGDGREIMTMSGDDWDVINRFEGLAPYQQGGAKIIPMYFDRLGLKTRAGTELTAIGTGAPVNLDANNPLFNPTPLNSLQLEMDLASNAGGKLALQTVAIQSAPRPLGVLRKRRKFNYNFSAAGTYDLSDLPKGDIIDAIYLKGVAGAIDTVRVITDNFIQFERTKALNDRILSDGMRRNPSLDTITTNVLLGTVNNAGTAFTDGTNQSILAQRDAPNTEWYVIDTSEFGDGSDGIVSAVQDFRIQVEIDPASTVEVILDYLGALQGN